jgi:hypothetical protein
MDYELAKQLRDAGFRHDWNMYDRLCKNSFPSLVLPTLEELIEACGPAFGGLFPPPGDYIERILKLVFPSRKSWAAASSDFKVTTYGLSASEAVARLWLVLHANTNRLTA